MQKAKADNKVLDLIKESKVGVDAGKMKARHLARLRLEHRDGPEDDANLPEDRTNALPTTQWATLTQSPHPQIFGVAGSWMQDKESHQPM